MSDDATPAKVRLTDQLGPVPEPWIIGGKLVTPAEGLFTASQMIKFRADGVAALLPMRKDAERYRFLRSQTTFGSTSCEGADVKDVYVVITGYGYQTANDAAIDLIIDERMESVCGPNADLTGDQ